MKNNLLDETMMTEYLLGLLSEEDQEQIETSFFQDDAYFEQLAALEDDLIDAYARGRLAGRFRSAFEKKLESNPRWRDRLSFAQALARRTGEPEAIAPRAVSFWRTLWNALRNQRLDFQLAAAGCAVVFIGSVVLLSLQFHQNRANLALLRSERNGLQTTLSDLEKKVAGLQEQERNLSRELDAAREARLQLETQEQQSGALGLVASFVLSSAVVRGANDQVRIVIPAAARTVRLQLDRDTVGEYPSYRVQLSTSSGTLVWSMDMLKAAKTDSAEAVVVQVPAPLLRPGEYELSLLGLAERGRFEEAAYYYFSVQ